MIYCHDHARWSKAEQFLGPLSATQFGWPYGDPKNSWDDRRRPIRATPPVQENR